MFIRFPPRAPPSSLKDPISEVMLFWSEQMLGLQNLMERERPLPVYGALS